jgi:hypothetical protein
MPPNNYDPAPTPVNPTLGEHRCPKCDVEMEPIETAADGPALQQLELCPSCYLVTWSDQAGLHVRQGVPMNNSSDPHSAPPWQAGEPEKC